MDTLAPTLEFEETEDMGSLNHSAVQANLSHLLKKQGIYSVYTELSLDVSQLDPQRFAVKDEIKPDVCVYPKRKLSRPYDILKMTEMPLLAIEILSPKQSNYEILQKFEVYFTLGVQSCWLVDPVTEVVAVYSTFEQPKTFSTDEVIDEKLELRLPLAEIFD
ncbi:MAG: Uma2 family endonuclease [Caldilineaceae bacterium]